MRRFVEIFQKYALPVLMVVTFFPRMLLRGTVYFFKAMLGFGVITSIILMATVLPYCLVAVFVANDTTPYWKGIGFSLFCPIYTLFLFLIWRGIENIFERSQQALARKAISWLGAASPHISQ